MFAASAFDSIELYIVALNAKPSMLFDDVYCVPVWLQLRHPNLTFNPFCVADMLFPSAETDTPRLALMFLVRLYESKFIATLFGGTGTLTGYITLFVKFIFCTFDGIGWI